MTTPTPRRRPRYGGTHPRRFQERYKELDAARYPQMQAHVRAQGRTPAGSHVPVMLAEALAALAPRPGDVVADCTVGYGGHAVEFLRRIAPGGRLIGLDADRAALDAAQVRLQAAGGAFLLRHANFSQLEDVLAAGNTSACDVIFADLGLSSVQIDDPERGFSYKADGPLDMRMDRAQAETAADLLAELPERDLADALADLGDEPDAARIAWAIVRRRAAGEAGPHPAARAFQALRILVNDELAALDALLRDAPRLLRPGGRIGILSFHSGEDRLVKDSFREGRRAGRYAAVSAEVLRPSSDEVRSNPRSAPARFRWAVRGS